MATTMIYDCATRQAALRTLTAAEESVAAALASAQATQEADTATLKALVVQTAQSAVGVRFDQLTAAQVRALAAILFWKNGALNKDGTVRTLADWT